MKFDKDPQARGETQNGRQIDVVIEIGEKLIVTRKQVEQLHFRDAVMRRGDVVENARDHFFVEAVLKVRLKRDGQVKKVLVKKKELQPSLPY